MDGLHLEERVINSRKKGGKKEAPRKNKISQKTKQRQSKQIHLRNTDVPLFFQDSGSTM